MNNKSPGIVYKSEYVHMRSYFHETVERAQKVMQETIPTRNENGRCGDYQLL